MRPFLTFLLLLVACSCESSGTTTEQRAEQRLTVLTYNILASEHRNEERLPALLALIESSNADIVCLQEVLPSFLERLREQPWFRARYRVPQLRGQDAIANGNCIFSRFEANEVRVFTHASHQGRESLIVHLEVLGQALTVATCHLESPLKSGELRGEQLADIFGVLQEIGGDALLAGDLNFGDGEQPETNAIPPDYVDLWTALHPGDPGFTWDITHNPMAERGSFVGETSRRLDRILLRSGRWRAHYVRRIGTQSIDEAGELHPSDHYGVLGVLVR